MQDCIVAGWARQCNYYFFFLTKTFCSLHPDKLQAFRSVKGRNIHRRASNERLAHCNYSCNHIAPPFSFLLTPSSVQTVRSCKNDVGPCPEAQEHVRVPQGDCRSLGSWILSSGNSPLAQTPGARLAFLGLRGRGRLVTCIAGVFAWLFLCCSLTVRAAAAECWVSIRDSWDFP